jgi:hypothetical protein
MPKSDTEEPTRAKDRNDNELPMFKNSNTDMRLVLDTP